LSVSRRVTDLRPAKHALIRYSLFAPSRTKSQSYEPSAVRFTTYPAELEWILRRST
jgi:hypothetical protein